jgi:hypothetical protein
MKLLDAPPGWWAYTQLGSTALAVVSRRVDGWCMYVAGVPGVNHHLEAGAVMDNGDKLDEATARAVCAHRFHPPIDTEGVPYAR